MDAFLNTRLPQLADKIVKLKGNYFDFDNDDIEIIVKTIKEFDDYYLSGWKDSEERQLLKEIVNNYCEAFRCYRFLIND